MLAPDRIDGLRIGAGLFLVVCLALTLLHVAGVDIVDTALNGPILCPVRRIVGIPCPGCGMTRAVVAGAAGEFALMWRFHPFAPVVVIGAAVVATLTPPRRSNFIRRPMVRVATVIALMLLLMRWVFVLDT